MAQHSIPAPVADRDVIIVTPLTEAEIVSMGEHDYMSEEQMSFFRRHLVELESSLLVRVQTATDQLVSNADNADPVDRASAEEEHQLALSNRVRDERQLIEIGAARRRIESGEFGWCVETGEMIGISRLLICPTTTVCVEAQQRRESNTKRYRV